MPLSLLGVVATSIPVFFSTIYRHLSPKRRNTELARSQANRELKYALSWKLVKHFLEFATLNTLESLQHFCNTYSPTPLGSLDCRAIKIPYDTISRAADYLIIAFGGEERCREVVGLHWWQLRDKEIIGEWYQAGKRAGGSGGDVEGGDPARGTILYITGGGFYFGSLATHRFMIKKHAKKSGMRTFAIDYRKAPQFPFPCGLHDVLAAYLYLIDPPVGAKHLPVPPSSIVLMGDSAGGGLVLAVLQVLRSNPTVFGRPAGAAIVSPWCDLTHSFPSVDANKEYDIIPPFSFIHKPSLAWPPPFEEAHPTFPFHDKLDSTTQYADPIAASSTVPLVLPLDNESLQITTQIQIYAPNHLLAHPLVSPALANLTGLPPLLVLVSDKESLRDEGIFVAHRVTGKGLVRKEIEETYPEMFAGQEDWVPGSVHLQVYDDASHILPVFSYTKIAQPCYSTIAAFCRHVTTPKVSHHEITRIIPSAIERRSAGDSETYLKTPFVDNMIRERVGIRGEIRPLEEFEELGAGTLIPAEIGVVRAIMVARLLEGRLEWSRKFPGEIEKMSDQRARLEKQWETTNAATVESELSSKLVNDNIPLGAIAGRHDTEEAQIFSKKMSDWKGRYPFHASSSAASTTPLINIDSAYASETPSPSGF